MARPRILITGFGPFPGAPVNPTEALIARLDAAPDQLATLGELQTEVLEVTYGSVPTRLATLGESFAPDIAIHFGLSARAHGFTLERLARNEIARDRPDNAGGQPESAEITPGGQAFASTLPLAAMAAGLEAAGLPRSWSDDAGGYLCNYLFYLACSPDFSDFRPRMAGFIHVPPIGDGPGRLSLDEMVKGAERIIGICVDHWQGDAPA